jgi:predicted nucleotide-binding protein/CheY-like chemotaxis protein
MAILIVEDDFFYGNQLAEMLSDSGVETLQAHTAEEALRVQCELYDAAIIDVMLPNDPVASGISSEESRGGFLTGVALARRLRKVRPGLKIVLITGDIWGSVPEEWSKPQGISVVTKSDGQRAIRSVLQDLGILKDKLAPHAFIVHGHDEVALLQLKNYLQNTLGWREPTILREQPNSGRTLIEKFEDLSGQADCVLVLLTPDDVTISKTSNESRRSRQNVIFELGFFFAQFGRQSGRVIVLHKGPNELPTDIQGIVWIGIDGGIETAGEELRRELARFTERPK